MQKSLLATLILLVSCSTNVTRKLAPGYFVSPNGDDKAAGDEDTPLKSVQLALDKARPGETVYLRRGVYFTKVRFPRSGNLKSGPIILRNYPDEIAILDGSRSGVEGAVDQMVLIEDKANVELHGLSIRNMLTDKCGTMHSGIMVRGAGKDIVLKDNHIYDIRNECPEKGGDAHGIAVYGTRSTTPIKNILIEGNELHDLKLGSSEALVVNGNVEEFKITGNRVHHADNIGIDVIGHEGKSPNPKLDQARNGIVSNNLVYSIASKGNPAYGNESSAGGIYIDGAKDILVEKNTVFDSDIGIEVASEHKGKSTSGITVRDNVLYGNRLTGLAFGGYDINRGMTINCSFVRNTLYHNNTLASDAGEVYMQFHTKGNIFRDNVVVAGPANIFISNRDGQFNTDNRFDHNTYFSSSKAGATFVWKGRPHLGLSSFSRATGQERNSLFKDPNFNNPEKGDFRRNIQGK